jgi:hypothetical protein
MPVWRYRAGRSDRIERRDSKEADFRVIGVRVGGRRRRLNRIDEQGRTPAKRVNEVGRQNPVSVSEK